MARPRQRAQARGVGAVSNPRLAPDVLRVHGKDWERLAWHGLVWSHLLIEVPSQLHAFRESIHAPLLRRIREIESFRPGDPDAVKLGTAFYHWGCPKAEICGDGRIVKLASERGKWPDALTVSIEFAMNGGGEVSVRCTNTPADRAKLPSVLQGPYPDQTARNVATRLVGAAILLVTETPPTPSLVG